MQKDFATSSTFRTQESGLTLVELICMIAIISITLSLAIPNYSIIQAKERRRTSLATFHHTLMLARTEANTKREYISICPSTDGIHCVPGSRNYSSGWIAFINADRDQPVTRDKNERLIHSVKLKSGQYSLIANRNAFTVRPIGKRSTNGTLIFCPTEKLHTKITPRALIVSYIGRPRLDNKPKQSHLKLCKV